MPNQTFISVWEQFVELLRQNNIDGALHSCSANPDSIENVRVFDVLINSVLESLGDQQLSYDVQNLVNGASTKNSEAVDPRISLIIGTRSFFAGKHADFVAAIIPISEQVPPTAFVHRLIGLSKLALGEGYLAAEHLQKALAIEPQNAQAWMEFGRVQESLQQTRVAIDAFEHAARFSPGDVEPLLSVASLLSGAGQLDSAIKAARRAVGRNAASTDAKLCLARVLRDKGNKYHGCSKAICTELLDEAIDGFQLVLAAEWRADVAIELGRAQCQLDYFDDAVMVFEQVVAQDPQSVIGWENLGNLALFKADLKLAEQHLRRALELDPHLAIAHFRYARAKRFQDTPETTTHVSHLLKLLEYPGFTNANLIHIHNALGQIYDDLKQYDRAWEHYDRGNKLKPGHSVSGRGVRTAKSSRHPSEIADTTIQIFSEELFCSVPPGSNSELPVFIVGMPRSGTTLTEQILSSHPEAHGAGELNDIGWVADQINALRVNELQFPFSAPYLSADLTQLFAETYLGLLKSLSNNERRVSDKMPTNFWHLGLIGLLFPKATIIHCRRNVLDICVSCFCQDLRPPFCDLDQIADYYIAYDRLAEHWKSVLPNTIHELHYEAMIADPEAESRKLLKHCKLEWNSACLDFHTNPRSVKTPSKLQVRKPIYNTSVEKWRRYEKHLGTLITKLQNANIPLPAGNSN